MIDGYTIPTYDYRKYARMARIPYENLLVMISAYNVQHDFNNKASLPHTEDQYYQCFQEHYLYLREIIDNNIEDGAIESKYYDSEERPFDDDDLPFGDDADEENSDDDKYVDEEEFDFKEIVKYVKDNLIDSVFKCDVRVSSFVDWAVRKQIPLPKVFIDYNLSSDLAAIMDKVYVPSLIASDNLATKTAAYSPEEPSNDNKLLYALEIGAFCNENSNDDYTPTFDDVVEYLAGIHGKNVVPDYLVKKILSHASESMAKKDGRPKKVLDNALRVGFTIREWYDENNAITEHDFNAKYKRDLSKTAVSLRSKAWKLLMAYRNADVR